MIPVVKLLTILAKTFTKPAVSLLKKAFYQRGGFARGHFIALGNWLHRVEVAINRRFLGVKPLPGQQIGNLPDDEAFEMASNFILEVVIVYGVLLSIAVSEVLKSMEDKKKMKADIEELKTGIEQLKDELDKVTEKNKNLEKIIEEFKNISSQIDDNVTNFKKLVEAQEKTHLESQQGYQNLIASYATEVEKIKREVFHRQSNENTDVSKAQ